MNRGEAFVGMKRRGSQLLELFSHSSLFSEAIIDSSYLRRQNMVVVDGRPSLGVMDSAQIMFEPWYGGIGRVVCIPPNHLVNCVDDDGLFLCRRGSGLHTNGIPVVG